MSGQEQFKFLTDTEFSALSLSAQAQYLVVAQQHAQMIHRKLATQLQAVVKAQQEQSILSPRHSQRLDPKKH